MDGDRVPANRYHPHAWLVGEPVIGDGTWIGAFTLIDGRGGLTIGRGCDISSGAHILSHSSARRCVSERRYTRVDEAPTVIEDHVFVGENATVLMGARVGHHSIVAAGSVVLEHTVVPPYSLVAGVPARVVRSIRAEVEDLMSEDTNPVATGHGRGASPGARASKWRGASPGARTSK
ncbi:MAG: acyltransferase [Candidatus Rokubacteria bacterium]|nr:acyltransferase [Candidatus Rokubacteria bacterium]